VHAVPGGAPRKKEGGGRNQEAASPEKEHASKDKAPEAIEGDAFGHRARAKDGKTQNFLTRKYTCPKPPNPIKKKHGGSDAGVTLTSEKREKSRPSSAGVKSAAYFNLGAPEYEKGKHYGRKSPSRKGPRKAEQKQEIDF